MALSRLPFSIRDRMQYGVGGVSKPDRSRFTLPPPQYPPWLGKQQQALSL